VILRAARPTDAGAAAAIVSGYHRDTGWLPDIWSPAETLALCGRMIDAGWVTVADAGGVQGFVARRDTEIVSLFVAAAMRGKGAGTRLLDAAKARADRLELFAFRADSAARGFYRRRGFAECTLPDPRPNEAGLPEVRMIWERSAA
jgi:GNAT superfamily N-acetyltransferase